MSKPILGFYDHDECTGIVWDTPKGKIVTIEGKLNPKNNLVIKNIETNETVDDIDWRDILSDILFTK